MSLFPSTRAGHVRLELSPDPRARGASWTLKLVVLGDSYRARCFHAAQVRPIRTHAEHHGNRSPLETFRRNPVCAKVADHAIFPVETGCAPWSARSKLRVMLYARINPLRCTLPCIQSAVSPNMQIQTLVLSHPLSSASPGAFVSRRPHVALCVFRRNRHHGS